MIIGTDLKKFASNLKPTVSAATVFLWWNVSMLWMTTKAYDNRYWFEEVCFEPETNGFCSNHSLMVRHLDVVHDSQNLRSSVLISSGLLRIRNQRYSATTFYVCDASQCCPLHQKWHDHRYWIEGVSFKSETNGFWNKLVLIVKRLSVVHANQNLGSSVLIWRGLLRMWNQWFLQQPLSHCETSHCCPWQPKTRNIGADLNRAASNLKPTVSATTVLLQWKVLMLSMTYWFEEACFECETNGFCNNHVLIVKRLSVVHDRQSLRSSVLIWKGLLGIRNQKVSATTILVLWKVSVLSMKAEG